MTAASVLLPARVAEVAVMRVLPPLPSPPSSTLEIEASLCCVAAPLLEVEVGKQLAVRSIRYKGHTFIRDN